MHFRPCPKTPRKPKKRKPIARRSRFRANENPFKTFKYRRDKIAVRAYAMECRLQRLANPTPAELAFADILRELAVEYEREKIFFYANGNRFILGDFFLPSLQIIIECDGSSHAGQKRYDMGRDKYFATRGIRTIRFDNKEVFRSPEAVKARIIEVTERVK